MSQNDHCADNTASGGNHDNGDNARETRGLCLLSLDGGGVRGLSILYILRALMQRLNDERRDAKLGRLKPCDVFDLIAGTSTGGLIAIMLGRLEMDVDECINAYKELMKQVFEKKQSFLPVGLRGMIKPRFSIKELENAVKTVLEKKNVSVDEQFYVETEDEDSRTCRVFVCSRAKETNHTTLLRSYKLKGRPAEPATIWEAALATSAATSFFEPVKIGDQLFVDGAIGANNPSEEVEKEASNIWCEVSRNLEPLVKCFISIGTGVGSVNPVSDKAWKFLTESLKNVATDTEATQDAVAGRWGGHWNTRYFRFNVERGLQGVGLAEYDKGGLISRATTEYLDSQDMKPRLLSCVMNLRKKKYRPNREFCIEQETLSAQRAQSREHNTKTATATELSEVMNRANINLKKPRDIITYKDLIEAYNDFHHVLRAKRDHHPRGTPKELTYLYNKLSTTCLRLSHFPNFTPTRRMRYVHEAEEFGKRALESAVKSQNNDRVVQMQFYLTFVKAQEIQLSSTEEQFQTPTQFERDAAVEAIQVAWALLKSIENLDRLAYDAMAKETISGLRRDVLIG